MALPTVIIQGNVCIEPNLQFTANGTAFARIRVAAGDRKKDELGNWIDGDTTFIDCTVWGHVAESAIESITKGTMVSIVGKLKSRTVEKDGGKQTFFEVAVDSIALEIRKWPKSEASSTTSDPWAGTSPF